MVTLMAVCLPGAFCQIAARRGERLVRGARATSLLAAVLLVASCSRRQEAQLDEAAWAADRPPYRTAAELCEHVNRGRDAGREHMRFKGVPWRGAYQSEWSWPVRFTEDASLDGVAQAEAERLAAGGAPLGTKHRDSSWRRPIWVDGVGTERETVSAEDLPGDWNPERDPEVHAALAETNGALRMAVLHQDSAPDGPALTRIGCGSAVGREGRSLWWVIVLAP
ncbi:MAG TPA: hypothetical protein VFD92_03085 [Candidatus Binatia bacterium]|nr:hypothetical protein [Candidatus Binatia bacterium]